MKKGVLVILFMATLILFPTISQAQSAVTAQPAASVTDPTVVEMQARIQKLFIIMAQLQDQIAKQTNENTISDTLVTTVPTILGLPATNVGSSPSCITFNSNLYRGIRNEDVARLQQFLRAEDDFMYPTNTGYFGPSTEQAVQKWQKAHSVVSSGSPEMTGYGVVGSLTREAIQSKTCENPTDPDQVIPSPKIERFTADPIASIPNNLETSVLAWSVSHATSCVLQNDSDEEIVPVAGVKTIHPEHATVYKLLCVNNPGETKDGPSVKTTLAVSPHFESNVSTDYYPVIQPVSQTLITITSSPTGEVTSDSVAHLTWETTGIIKKIGIGFCPVGQTVGTKGCTQTVYINNSGRIDFSVGGFFTKQQFGQYYPYFKDFKSDHIYGLGNAFILST